MHPLLQPYEVCTPHGGGEIIILLCSPASLLYQQLILIHAGGLRSPPHLLFEKYLYVPLENLYL